MLYIRVDMNDSIATGHMMRCLAIADAARNLGEETMFVLADAQAAGLLSSRGYRFIVLGTPWDDMEAELPELILVIRKNKIPGLLVDSYQVTKNYLRELQNETQVCYIDDLYAFPYPVDTMICYEIYCDTFDYWKHYTQEQLYLGTDYAPLKAAFCGCSEKNIHRKAECLLLLFGGAVPYDFLEQLLKKMERDAYREIHVVCARSDTKYEMLCETYKMEKNVRIHPFVTNLDILMKRADLAVSAGGVTIYELCACGTPTISYAMADNQLGTVRKFAEDGVIAYAGDIRKDPVADRVCSLLRRYRCDQQLRRERSRKMQKLVDGKGAQRIAKILMGRKGKTE